MRTFLITSACIATLCIGQSIAMDQTELARLNSNLHDADAKVRIMTIEKLSGQSPELAGNTILPFLITALKDSEPKVRSSAAAVLASIAYSTMPKHSNISPGKTDLKNSAEIQAALVHAIRDTDKETRKSALTAYVLTYSVSISMQDELADRFDRENDDPQFQQDILVALTIDGNPSRKANLLLDRLANNTDTTWMVSRAVTASLSPPAGLLAQFVNQLSKQKSSDKRAEISRGITKYGGLAKPYLHEIQSVASRETDQDAKLSLETDIKAIQSAR